MNVVVLGAGSIGSLFAGRLAASGVSVTLIGRAGRHLDTIERDGLTIEHTSGETERVSISVTTDPGVVETADWTLLAVKSYDTASAMADIAPWFDEQPILTVQNGLGNPETIADFVAPRRIIAGTTSHGVTRPEPGVIRHAGTGATTIGRYFADNDPMVEAIAATLTAADIDTTVTDAAQREVWEKVLVNVGINATTALTRVPNGSLSAYPSGERLLNRAVEEALHVAQAEGQQIRLDIVDRTRDVAESTSSNRSSMLQDIEAGSKTEIEAINGAIVARGDDHGIETPVNRTLTDLIKLAETGFDE